MLFLPCSSLRRRRDEQKAFFLYSSLLNEKIEAVYEPVKNSQGILVEYDVWIVSEDDFERALQIHDGLSTNPNTYLHHHRFFNLKPIYTTLAPIFFPLGLRPTPRSIVQWINI